MTGSYNETLSTSFSKMVRDSITEKKADKDKVIFSDIFPQTNIKQGDGAANLWSLEKGNNNYLATSPTGTATGFGANIIVIDDLIKNASEANNSLNRDKQWSWFTDTMLSRLEGNEWKIIVVMTRWHSKDLAGRLISHCNENKISYKQILYKAIKDDGSMLCDDILNHESYTIKTKTMSPEIALANYQQEPIDLKGTLYKSFKTYDEIPKNMFGNYKFTEIKSYCDTADTGDDYLCNIIYGVLNREAYILDVYYTKDHMEITEKEVAKRLTEFKVNNALVEGNNGGRGFARQVERNMRELGNHKTIIRTFHQSNNKNARILSNATWVMEHIYYPSNWHNKWNEYFVSMKEYQREGKNPHDDAQDATTGVAENIIEAGGLYFG
ncbi:phage terminase large subunit [Peptoniphilus gorbachii]|uniref:Phage terminase large subunit-like protein n=1 Tax=Peptoniphilus gorbachii TaxID=411567 RepID=A0ABS2MKI9_9FIRM|nr:phage terminase large subunit [Peptoniphilus gorbachii]MBM7550529.1 putative phage terminase large subunit-like protein [Peptoniphilus gorbachii]MDU1582672.1 phage terminase large subunit [Peptoniphilus harei]MDU1663751.1 phage terminase large subunit [Peptoniphilus harei]